MDQAARRVPTPTPVVFVDGFGERRHIVDPTGTQKLEVLCLRSELTGTPSFEFALRERVSRLAGFRHAYFARVRAVERLGDAAATLALVSDGTAGVRLSQIMATVERDRLPLDINAALSLLRQIVPAAAALHESARDVAHGAIALERIVVTPNARAVLVEHVLGAAAEQLRFTHERYWKELRIAAPRSASLPKLDQRADVMQIGMVALALFLGRRVADDEYPARLADLVDSISAISSRGDLDAFPEDLRKWLLRALQVNPRDAFSTANEAREELERVLAETDYLATPGALEAFVNQSRAYSRSDTDVPVTAYTPPPPAPPSPSFASELVMPPVAAPPPAVMPAPPAAITRTAAPREIEPPAPPIAAPAPPVIAPPPAPAAVAPPPPLAAAPVVPKPEPSVVKPAPSSRPPAADLVEQLTAHTRMEEPSYAREDTLDMADGPTDRRRMYMVAAGVAAVIVLALGGYAARGFFASAPPAPVTGTVIVNTSPAGAQVFIDGQAKGASPLTVNVNPGSHTLEIRGSGDTRSIPVNVAAGTQVSQYIELSKAATTGQLQISTQPSGARVTVDGIPRGTSPITVADLLPGEHTVVVDNDGSTTKQTVQVEAGATASVVAQLTAPQNAPLSGWISVSAPADVQLFENGRLLGSSQTDRVMVPIGTHQLEIVNEALGFRGTRSVQVSSGKVANIKVEFPKGTIALNAVPWAEVWIDGERIGETPIGNYQVTIGPHDIVFRHPDLGEQRHVAQVTLLAPTRLSVDMRKK
jgi:hypothetical protein